MKSKARCWTLPAAAPMIAMLWLTGCAVGGFDALATCPPIVEYSVADQFRAAAEIEALPEGAVMIEMMSDYAVVRDQARACR